MFQTPVIRFFSTFSLFFNRHIDKSGNTMYTIISDEVEIWLRQVSYFTKNEKRFEGNGIEWNLR